MTDEEKKAIEMLINYDNEDNLHKIHQSINVVLNLIEKQSKEIEGLKEDNKKKSIVIIEYQDLYEKLQDKIKAKIEEYKKQIEKMEKDDIGRGFTLGKEWSDLKAKVEFGQSLLEKE